MVNEGKTQIIAINFSFVDWLAMWFLFDKGITLPDLTSILLGGLAGGLFRKKIWTNFNR